MAHDLDSTRIGHEQAGKQLEQGGLSRPIRPQEGDELAGVDREADTGDGLVGAVAFHHIVEEQGRGPVIRWSFNLFVHRHPVAAIIRHCVKAPVRGSLRLPDCFDQAYAGSNQQIPQAGRPW